MPIELPLTPAFTHARLYLQNRVQTFDSALSGTQQTRILSGSLWEAEYSLPAMARTNWQIWTSFFDRLNGKANTFNAICADNKNTLGTSTGTPLVNGASQTGTSIITDGWTASTLVLKAGDYISIESELKRVTQDVTSDGGGNATINFVPKIRVTPLDNASVITEDCKCEMRLNINNINFRIDPSGISEPLTFNAREVI